MGNTARTRKVSLPRRKQPKKAKPPPEPEIGFGRESITLFLVVVATFVGLSLYSFYSYSAGFGGVSQPNMMGRVGAQVSWVLVSLLGWCSFAIVVWALLLARRVWIGKTPAAQSSFWSTLLTVVGSLVMVSSAATFVAVLAGARGGGRLGGFIAHRLIEQVSAPGTVLISFALFLLALSMSTGLGTAKLLQGLRAVCVMLFGLVVDAGYVVKHSSIWFGRRVLQLFGAGGRGGLQAMSQVGRAAVVGGRALGQAAMRRQQLAEQPVRQAAVRRQPTPKATPAPAEQRGIRVRRQTEQERRPQRTKKTKAVPPPKKAKQRFRLPSVETLVAGEVAETSDQDDQLLIENSQRLEQALADFRIGGEVVEVQPGPVITLYQFVPAAGVKVQRIISLADDLALALRVASVRVYAPVPGKGTVGIEVPNEQREVVRLREIFSGDVWRDADAPLVLGMGKDTFGNPYVANLARMPHLLIAGATGTGKSVCINSILMSLLFRNTPDDLQLILIDPKMLELSMYEDIPHLKAPVVTNPKRARGVLWWAVEEMERRYRLMKELGVRNLASYNRVARGDDAGDGARRKANSDAVIELQERNVVATDASGEPLERADDEVEAVEPPPGAVQLEVLPRIVIVVDELADLMLTVGREVEELFTRLAQKARAAGIHLILATQRPSVNVITGLIKANFPARVSFKVATRIDSRTVLDGSGAEKLLGDGDMLFVSPATRGIVRLHGAFVSDDEVADVVGALRNQGPPKYDDAIEQTIKAMEEAEKGGGGFGGDEEFDPLYDQAVNLVVEKGAASTSMVQRAFRIGYNRAARILESMEREGVVGPADGSRPREILAGRPEL